MKYLRLLPFFTLFPLFGFSQPAYELDEAYWVAYGFSTYVSREGAFGFGQSADIGYLRGSFAYKIHYHSNDETDLFAPLLSEKFNHLSLMFGTASYLEDAYAGVLVGVGITGGIKRGRVLYTFIPAGWFSSGEPVEVFEKKTFLNLSIPVEFYILAEPDRIDYVGGSISILIDINATAPTLNFTVKFSLGKFD